MKQLRYIACYYHIILLQKCIHFNIVIKVFSFFVTDNKLLKQELTSRYPFIFTYNSIIGHSEKNAIQDYSQVAADSLIEMYLFSKCDIIVKTQYSTFSDTSKLIGGHF